MKILVIFTGGTIGSTVSSGIISSDTTKKYKLISLYKESGDDTEFVYDEPYTILSENLTGEYVRKLGECLKKHIEEQKSGEFSHSDISGIIVTHGTDTLQYSAAAMDLMFHDIGFPIVFVSSNFVLDDPAANGLANFAAAVNFIKRGLGNGVFAAYRNADNKTYIHRGSNLLPHKAYSFDVESVCNKYMGIMNEDGTWSANENYSICCQFADNLHLPTADVSGILKIIPYPGMTYPSLHAVKPRAVLMETYHSGTICSINPGLEIFCNEASEMGIPVFLIGAKPGPHYASVEVWKDMHINILDVCSPVAAYMKLWMALEANADSKDLMQIMMGK